MSRLALVTGGTRGIGAASALALREAGHRVAVNFGSDQAVADKFTADTGIAAYKWDVGDFAACKAGVKALVSDLGEIDILVNNAGTASDNRFENLTEDQWHDIMRVNLDSVFYMSKLVYPAMISGGWGRIINVGSLNAQAGQINQVNYIASKAGMHGFTKALALEGAKHGITVNTVAPGYVRTALLQAMPERIIEKIIAKSAVRRLGTEEEVAHAVVFLADEKAAWTTGSTISMNGGTYMS